MNGLSCGAGGQQRRMNWSWTYIGESVKPEIYDHGTSWHHKARFRSSVCVALVKLADSGYVPQHLYLLSIAMSLVPMMSINKL